MITSHESHREVVLHVNQLLSGSSGGVLQAIAAYIATIPIVNDDTFVLTDGVTTETWTFVTTRTVAQQVAIGATAATAQTALVAAINADSALWSAVETKSLGRFFAAAPDAQFIVYRKAPPSIPALDRAYGHQTTAAGIKVLAFSQAGYSSASATESSIPAADPAAKTFGFGRERNQCLANEEHRSAEDSFTYQWHYEQSAWRFQWHLNDLGLATWPYPGTTVYLACTGASAELAADLPPGHYMLVSDTPMTFIVSASGGGGTAVHQTTPGMYWGQDVPFYLSLRAAKRIAVIMGGLSGKLCIAPLSAPPVI